jgi:hypothetical protein|tara:strand:- start:1109 stop:1306 length:198 start_codon:yes stop_codon:yes gene_type:complete
MDALHLAQYLLKSVRERDVRLKDKLADGSIQTLDEYRFIVGQIRGMSYVEDEIKAAMKGIEYSDD